MKDSTINYNKFYNFSDHLNTIITNKNLKLRINCRKTKIFVSLYTENMCQLIQMNIKINF